MRCEWELKMHNSRSCCLMHHESNSVSPYQVSFMALSQIDGAQKDDNLGQQTRMVNGERSAYLQRLWSHKVAAVGTKCFNIIVWPRGYP